MIALAVNGRREAGHRVVHHTNVVEAAKTAGVSRILYTSLLNADETSSPFAGEHQESERVLRDSGVSFTLLRNGFYTEVYTEHLSEYLESGEIVGAAGTGRISAATRLDFATAAAATLLQDEPGNRTYELGAPAFNLPELAQTISEVTGAGVRYRNLSFEEYANVLQHGGLDAATARFVVDIDASLARGDLQTTSRDLAQLLRRPPTSLADAVRAEYGVLRLSSAAASV